MSKFEEILEKLENVKMNSQKNATALCPNHNDTKNSLSITETEEGKILFHCFAGCNYDDIINSIGYSKKALNSNKKGKEIVAYYDYLDEHCNLLYQVVRTKPKGFFQRRPTKNGGWVNGLGDVRRIVYNLPEVLMAINMSETIFWVEGEKDVENLKKLGLKATTTPMGAGSWKEEYSEFFANADVVLLPDADEPGEKYVQTVAKTLKYKNAKVRILRLPNLKAKGDVSDWISQGGTKKDLLNLIKDLPEYEISNISVNIKNSIKNITFSLSDLGNAERLVTQYSDTIKYCCEAKTWLIWNGIRWEWDTTGQIERLAKKVVKSIYSEANSTESSDERIKIAKWALESKSKTRIKAMIELAKTEESIPIKRSDLDKDDWLLNCINGTIELKKGILREHRREDFITLVAPVNYVPNATSEILEKFIDRILPDEELKEFVQVAAGYGITGDTSEEKLFFAYGPAATGKSTLFAGIKATLGDYGSQTDFTTFLDQGKNGAVRNDVARLAGKRFVLTSEVDEGKKLAESLVKQITGNDTITARFLYQESFEFVPKMKIFMAANFRPKVNANDNAMWRRICQIPFIVHIPKDERDPSIKKFLSDPVNGGPAILSWLVDGCLKWQRDGLNIPKIVEDFTNEYKEEMDPIRDFLDDCCVKGTYANVNNTKLYQEYEDWAKETGEKYIMSRKRFSQSLELKGFIQKRTSRERVWEGIGLKANNLSDENIPGISPKIIELNIDKVGSVNKKDSLQDLLF